MKHYMNKKRKMTSSSTWTVHDALEVYYNNRKKEHKSLIRIARFGSPYQYRQPGIISKIGALLWTFNISIRLLMYQLSFKLLPAPPAAIICMIQKPNWSYYQIMKYTDTVTILLRLGLLSLLSYFISLRYLKPFFI